MFFGLILILIGTLFLLRNLGILPMGIWPIFWPSLLILIGIYLVSLSLKVRHLWKKIWEKIWKKLE